MTSGPQPHHRRVILDTDLLRCRRAQRGDRDRERVVRVVLVGRLGGEQPHPRRQLRLHVQDPLAGGHQLLGEQVAEAGGVLDRPLALGELLRPLQQLLELLGARPHSQLGEAPLAVVDCNRSVRSLVRVDADHHRHRMLLLEPTAASGDINTRCEPDTDGRCSDRQRTRSTDIRAVQPALGHTDPAPVMFSPRILRTVSSTAGSMARLEYAIGNTLSDGGRDSRCEDQRQFVTPIRGLTACRPGTR
jgi:hypothetical protein